MTAKLPSHVRRLILLEKFLKGIGLKKSSYARKQLCFMDQPVPVDPQTVYFDSYYGAKIDCNPLAIFRAFNQRYESGTYRYVWVREPGASVPDDVANNSDVVFVRLKSFENQIELRRAKYIIQNNNLPSDFAAHPDQVILNTWHGIPIKTLGVNFFPDIGSLYNVHRSFNVSDIILSSGDFYTQQAIHCNHAPIKENAIQTIGFPRLDGLAKAAETPRPSPSEKPILLYAPTWRGTLGKIDKEVAEQINVCRTLAISLGDDYDIYANLHHLASAKVDLSQQGVKTIPKNLDMNQFLEKVALLVTDYSSIALDFLVLDRPAILYAHDLEAYRKERGFAVELDTLPFAMVKTLEDLVAAIKSAQKPSTFANFASAREKFLGAVATDTSEQAIDITLNLGRSENQKTKHRVLLFAGSFQQNGMTTSLINLTKMIDYDRIDLFIAVRPSNLDEDSARRDLFNRLDPRVRILLWTPGALLHSDKDWVTGARVARKSTNRNKIILRLLKRFRVVAQRHWRDIEFDATVVFTGYNVAASLLALSTNARRKAIFLHNDMAAEIERKDNVNWMIPEMYSHYDKVVSVSPALMDINGQNLRPYIPERNQTYCRNTLDHVEMRRRAKQSCFVADEMRQLRTQQAETKIYMHAGRFSHEKNHRLLLDAFHEVLKVNPKSHLWLVGNGPLYDEIVAYAEALNLTENAHFTGWLDNPAPAMKEANAFVLSSIYEGQPMVLLEAMTLGLRCVAVDSPQVRYVLDDGLGLITPPTQAGLAAGMLKATDGAFAPPEFDPVRYNQKALDDFYDVIGLPGPEL